jgi:hypothetical protein
LIVGGYLKVGNTWMKCISPQEAWKNIQENQVSNPTFQTISSKIPRSSPS